VSGLSVLPKVSARNLDLKLNTVVNIKDTAAQLVINYPAMFLSLSNSVLIDNQDAVNAVTVQINKQLSSLTIAAGNFRAFNDAWIEQINLTGPSTNTQVTSQVSPLTQLGIGGVTN
tara:strand:+ start:234 stop:581 length:348 start_codon:yes stop_codon:yes gene_type:complete